MNAQTRTVTIGGRTYKVTERPARKNAEWRAELAAAFGPLARVLEQVPQMLDVELTRGEMPRLAELVQAAGGALLAAPDELRRLLYLYAPQIGQDAEALEEAAYDSEYLAAFTAVLQLAYPFGSYLRVLRQVIQSGSAGAATGPNSHSPNGGSGTTK